MSQINGDNEFEGIEDAIRPCNLHIVGAGEHVGDVERSIRTLKEGTRCHIHRIPYKTYPKIMVAGMVLHVTKSLNNLPTDTGINANLSPSSLITGCPPVNFNSVMMLNFGDYVQVHEARQVKNNNKPRTVGAIALYPRSDSSWYFMSLESGKRLHRYKWTVLPATVEVVNRVNELGKRQKQPEVTDNFIFSWEHDPSNISEHDATSINES